MVPKDKKDKETPKETNKRRNSLTDGSSSSSSTSTTDSDEGTGVQSKATMTAHAFEFMEEITSAADDLAHEATRGAMATVQQRLRNNTNVTDRTVAAGFRSLSDQYPEAMPTAQPPENSSKGNSGKRKPNKKGKLDLKGGSERTTMSDLATFESLLQQGLQNRENASQPVYISSTAFAATIDGTGVAGSGQYDDSVAYDERKSNRLPKYGSDTKPFDWIEEYRQKRTLESGTFNRIIHDQDAILAMKEINEKNVEKIKNKYLRQTHRYIFAGKPRKAFHRIRAIVNVLRTHSNLQNTSFDEVLSVVVMELLRQTTDHVHGVNAIMSLVSMYPNTAACLERKHGDCLMADLLLSALTEQQKGEVLSLECKSFCNRRAIHFATITGQPCQLEVLLKHRVNADIFDSLEQAPMNYVYIRDHFCMYRQLMWYGCDLNLLQPSSQLMPKDFSYNGNEPVGPTITKYNEKRLPKLEAAMTSWIRRLTNDYMMLGDRASLLHCTRITRSVDAPKDQTDPDMVVKRLSIKMLNVQGAPPTKTSLASEGYSLLLFMLPVAYTPSDVEAQPENPSIVRIHLTDSTKTGRSTYPFISSQGVALDLKNPGPPPRMHFLHNLFPNLLDNGHFYVFKLPSALLHNDNVELSFAVNPSLLPARLREHTRIFIQAFVGRSRKPSMQPQA